MLNSLSSVLVFFRLARDLNMNSFNSVVRVDKTKKGNAYEKTIFREEGTRGSRDMEEMESFLISRKQE